MTYKRKPTELPIADIRVGRRHRKDMGDIAELAASMAELGLLQAIGVRPNNELIWGERRLRAAQQLGWTTIPVKVMDLDAVARGADAKGEAGEPASKKPREKEPRASTTDAQARVMKMADGGFRPAYNVQFATDTKSTAIAGVSVDNSDMGKMLPMNDALAGQYGTRPRQHLADGGFAKLDDIEALAQNGVETFVPVPKPRNADRDRHAPQPSDPPGVADWRNRMGGDDAKTIYKERAATAECANAQARNRGLTQFLVRSMDKVKTIALWHALTHNMVLHVASDAGITQRRDPR